MRKKIVTAILVAALAVGSLSGCALLDNEVNELNGSITGNTYNACMVLHQSGIVTKKLAYRIVL